MRHRHNSILLAMLSVLIGCSDSNGPEAQAGNFAKRSSWAINEENFPVAENYARRAVELQPEVWEYRAKLGMALAAQNKTNEAIVSYERSLELQQNTKNQKLTDQAMLLVFLGREAEAEVVLEKFNSKNPEYVVKIQVFLSDDTGLFRIP